jgi:signal transduction histidine kinase/ActR/RegA family two-component response regulator
VRADGWLSAATRIYRVLLVAGLNFAPTLAIAYMVFDGGDERRFLDYTVHEISIGLAILPAAFITYVSWQCYRVSREPFLRFLTLAFLAFTVIYAPHGMLTRQADCQLWLFLLYGPVSRLAMMAFLLAAFLRWGAAAETADSPPGRKWLPWLALIVVSPAGVAYAALAGWGPAIRLICESGSIALCGIAALVLLQRRRTWPLRLSWAALLIFSQSAFAFILAKPWSHLWWLAHGIFAVGFFLLSYGVVRAYQSTRSFTTVFSETEMIAQLAASTAETAAAHRNADHLRRMFAASPVAVVVADQQDAILFRNRRAEALGVTVAALPPAIAEIIHSRASGESVALELDIGTWVLASWASIAYEDLPAWVVWLTDFTDRKQAEDALRRVLAEKEALTAEAQAATAAKSRFLAAASHDIRQPLVPVKLFAELLGEEVHEPAARALVGKMQGALQSLDDLLARLLDFSRVEAGAVQAHLEDVELAPLLLGFQRDFRAVAGAKGLELRVVPCSEVVRSDGVLLQQILRNLLENAIRYTGTGRVLMGCRLHGESIRLCICDTGLGIPEDQIAHIFDEFYQIGNQNRDRHQGLGLGLATVDRLCRLLGHGLQVASEPGRGSMFSLDLPRCLGVEASPVLLAPPQTHAAVAPLRVLLVEDDHDVRDAMLILMVRWGWDVASAASCAEAMAAVEEFGAPDVVVTDLRLEPQLSGLDVIGRVNAACGMDVPAIVVTGDSSHPHLATVQAGPWPVLVKPFSAALLRSTIEGVVGELASRDTILS